MAATPTTATSRFWHPFADMGAVSQRELLIERGEGVWVYDADVRVPEASGAVEIAAVVGVIDPHPLPALDQQLALGDGPHVGERVPEA